VSKQIGSANEFLLILDCFVSGINLTFHSRLDNTCKLSLGNEFHVVRMENYKQLFTLACAFACEHIIQVVYHKTT
jgi:hypothetical protein